MDRKLVEALFERSTTPMVLVDDDRRYRDCNAAACEALKTSREELLGSRIDARLPPERRPGLDERWQRFLEMESYSGETSFLTAEGRVMTARQSSTPNVIPGLHLLVFLPEGEDAALDQIIQEPADEVEEPRALTPREREVITFLALGLTGKQVAERLVLSPETVRVHVRNARTHLGARTRAHAIALALKRGEIKLER